MRTAPRAGRRVGRTATGLLALLVAGALASGCGITFKSNDPPKTHRNKLTVFAATSLTGAFTAIGDAFEEKYPGVRVVFTFGSSPSLVQQIQHDAPAGVLASDSPADMIRVVKADDASAPQDFATNTAELVVPRDNPAHIGSVKDLAKKGVKVAVCQATLPCGSLAREVFKKAGVTVTPASEETDVTSVLSQVESGGADAGIVYVTDAKSAGTKVLAIPLPDSINAATAYPIAPLVHAAHQKIAQEFVDFVLSDAGQAALAKDGFKPPPD